MFKIASFLIIILIVAIDLLLMQYTHLKLNYNIIFSIFNLNFLTFFLSYICFNYKDNKYRNIKLSWLSWGFLGFIAAGIPTSILTFIIDNNIAIYGTFICVISFFIFIGVYFYNNKGKKYHKYQREITIVKTINTVEEGRYDTVYEMHRLKRDGLFPIIIIEFLILLSLLTYLLYNNMIFDYISYGLIIFASIFLIIYLTSHFLKYSYSNQKTLNY